MKKILIIFGLFLSYLAEAQCVSCYSLEDAMVQPFAVKELILKNKGLTEIPSEIAQMKNLEILDLSQNQILEIGNRLNRNEALRRLNLSRNFGLSTVSAADSFYLLPQLIEIDLSYNGAEHISTNLGNLKSLQKLRLSHNRIQILPQTLSDLPQLTYLDISNNGMERVDMSFANLWHLNYLDISGNFEMNRNEIFQNLQFKANLKTLRCNISSLNKNMATCLNSTGIEELIIVDSEVDKIHGSIAKNRTLHKVTFSNSTFLKPGATYRNLNSIRNLDELAFVQTAIDPSIKDMTKLKTLHIDNSTVSVDALSKNKSLSNVAWVDDAQNVVPLMAVVQGQKKEFKGESNDIEVSDDMAQNKVTPVVPVPPSVQSINPTEDVVLVFTDTECAIQKETFLDENGKVYKGKVTIELTEYFDPITNALAGAPMTAQNTSGKDEIFASNGMINFAAKTENGQALQIDPQKPVQITLRDVQPDVEGNLFSFNDSTNTWQNVGTARPSRLDSLTKVIYDSLALLSDDQFASFIMMQPRYSVEVNRKRHDAYALKMHTPLIAFKGRRRLDVNALILHSKREDMKWLSKKTWYLDTTVSKQMDSICKALHRSETSYQRTVFNYYSTPRLLGDMFITPDLDRDHYRMHFTYKGEQFSWPVYFHEKENLKQEIAAQKKFYHRYAQKRRSHERFLEATKDKRAQALKKAAETNRQIMAATMANMRLYGNAGNAFNARRMETLKFGITTTGLYNCDYFYRVRPDTYVALSTTLYDQNGDKVETPLQVRYILMEDNAYFELPRERVPLFKDKRSIVIMVLSAVEIAVITSWEYVSGKLTPIVKRINIEGKTPNEVRQAMFEDDI